MLPPESSWVLKLMKKVENNEPRGNTVSNHLTQVAPQSSLLCLIPLFFLALSSRPTFSRPLSPATSFPSLLPADLSFSGGTVYLHVCFTFSPHAIQSFISPQPCLLHTPFHLFPPFSSSCLLAWPFIRSHSCYLMGCCFYGNAGRTCLHSSMRKTIACRGSLLLSYSLSRFLFCKFSAVKFRHPVYIMSWNQVYDTALGEKGQWRRNVINPGWLIW